MKFRNPKLSKALTVFATCVLLLMPGRVSAEDGDAEFSYAAGYFKKERWKYASEAFAEFLQQYPSHSRANMAQLYCGLALNKLDEFDDARQQLRKFIADYPTSQNLADAQFHVAECSYNLRDYQAAVDEFSDYLNRHQNHNLRGWAALMLGESQNELARWPAAEATLLALVNSNPDVAIAADAMFALGVALQGGGKPQEAVTAFQKVVATRSPALTHRAWARIGTTYFTDKNYAAASEAYDQLAEQFPEMEIAATATLQSAIAQFQLKNFEQALTRFDSVPASTVTGLHAAMWMGFCYRELGQLDTARKALSAAFAEAGDSPMAAEILYNRAQVELIDNQKPTAAQMFLDLSDRWPDDARVAESLFNAAQLKMEIGDAAATQRILRRLQTDHPQKAQEPAVRVLNGRLLLSDGKIDDAIATLQAAVDSADGSPREQLFRQYHLVRALHRGGKFAETVATFEMMRPQLAEAESSELFGAAALAAMSCLETKEFAKGQEFADQFLQVEKDPRKRLDAIAARAVALTHLSRFDEAQNDLKTLVSDASDNPQTWRAVLQSAESAWAQDDFKTAATFFGFGIDGRQPGVTSQVNESALFGAAWSRYNLQEFADAAQLFLQIYQLYPESKNAAEAAYMEALSLFDSGEEKLASERLAVLYSALEKRPKEDPDRAKYLLDAGRLYAGILGKSGQIDEANGIWERLVTAYDGANEVDAILDSWAYLNLQAGQYAESDEIYRRLLKDFPHSRFAGQARLSLAESEMQANRLDTALAEFTTIVEEPSHAAAEREAALYHVIDIHAARRAWPEVMKYGEQFAEEFSGSNKAPRMQLLYAEALLDQKHFAAARDKLASLRNGVLDGSQAADEWTERIWVAFAEVALAEKRYTEIDLIEQEFRSRTPDSRFTFQMNDVQGRRWKSQGTPDFQKSREYFRQVTNDSVGGRTETGARCQFLIGETFLLQNDYSSALKEYYRVYLSYPFDDWRARGLYQAAGCEVALKDTDAAKRSYSDLIKDFPGSEWAIQAKEKLDELAQPAK